MKNWIEKEQLEEGILQSLKKDLKIDDFICTLLLQREVDSLKKAQNFFRPDINLLHDPFLMKDMKKVVEKIQNLKEHRIMILGDYDVDGTTSTAMLQQAQATLVRTHLRLLVLVQVLLVLVTNLQML